MEIFATTVTVLFCFRQIVHDPFPDQILCQRLPRPVRFLTGASGGFSSPSVSAAAGSSLACLVRLPGLPEFFKQLQLLFRELFAFAIALRVEKLPQQAAVLVLFRAFVLELLAQVHHDLLQQIDVFRQGVRIDGQ